MKIKYLVKGVFALALCITLNSCSKDEEAPKDKIPASAQGTFHEMAMNING